MRPGSDALASQEASITIAARPEDVYALVSDVTRMGEWSMEASGATWADGATGQVGDWFDGHNQTPEREWTRNCQVAAADPGRDFTFAVLGIEANCTWWSFEMEPDGDGTRLTQRWWLVNKTPAMQAVTQEQFDGRVAFTLTMMEDTIAGVKRVAEAAGQA